MTKVQELSSFGQSIWYDNIRRALLEFGGLQELVDSGVTGVTSNPSIFEKAIDGSDDYDDALGAWVTHGLAGIPLYEALVIEDIQRAADILRSVYDRTAGGDGYVSLEVSPTLAHDTEGTIAEAKRLFAALQRPNVMIKVPATPPGIPAIETLIGLGININVTLMFSLGHLETVANAYMAGLERLAAAGGDLTRVASVASFFVSRVDTVVDRLLEEAGVHELQGKIAIANAKAAYARSCEIFSGERWERLAARGARVQRPLWASTGTKNPRYSDTLYVDSLIGPNTVNTVPPATLDAYLGHGLVAATLEDGLTEAHEQLAHLKELGIDLESITEQLQHDGVVAFANAFESLLSSIAGKRARFLKEQLRRSACLGEYQLVVDKALDRVQEERIVERVWAHDHTVWKNQPTEIVNRLGWLHIAEAMREQVETLNGLADTVVAEGCTDVLLLGMGGSSLAPDVLANVFSGCGKLGLAVLDSTDPGAVLAHAECLDPASTLFIVSTKSGGTAETISFFKFFYNRTVDALGANRAGEHFIAITDPGSRLAELATQYKFRTVFLNDPNIGGRYSVLSYFGLVPAALAGIDINRLLDRALLLARGCEPADGRAAGENSGAWLGVILGELAKAGRDKVTLIAPPQLANFGDWVEQLIAESTGKEGKGILPIVGEPLGAPGSYGEDRLFVQLRLDSEDSHDAAVVALEDAGHPVVHLHLRDLYDLGAQFFLWEMATAISCHCMGVNPFDQPDVEAAKVLARNAMEAYSQKGVLPDDQPASFTSGELDRFLAQAESGDYVALQAYLQPTARTDAALLALRTHVRDRLKAATTVGYGPRFLHSTGQLHKGDAGNGLFVQFTVDDVRDVPIPDEAGHPASSVTFGVLKTAQMLGDKQALLACGRRVIRFHLGDDVCQGLLDLAGS